MKRSIGTIILVLVIEAVGFPSVQSQIYTGKAAIIDGDTIQIQGQSIRLYGIDAPELAQNCVNSKQVEYRCGLAAKNFLKRTIGSNRVDCSFRGRDGFHRILAECWVEKNIGNKAQLYNLNELMITSGYAFVFTKYGGEFVVLENYAKRNKKGMWSGNFQFPWEFREKLPPAQIPTGNNLLLQQNECGSIPRYCKLMRSCQQACFALRQCGRFGLDRDRDGIPCENICRRRCQ